MLFWNAVANFADFAPEIYCMAMSLEQLEKEGHILNLRSNAYYTAKIW